MAEGNFLKALTRLFQPDKVDMTFPFLSPYQQGGAIKNHLEDFLSEDNRKYQNAIDRSWIRDLNDFEEVSDRDMSSPFSSDRSLTNNFRSIADLPNEDTGETPQQEKTDNGVPGKNPALAQAESDDITGFGYRFPQDANDNGVENPSETAQDKDEKPTASARRLYDELSTFGFGPKSIYDLLGEGSDYWNSDAGRKFLSDNPDFIVDQYTIPRLQMPGNTPYWMALTGMTDDGAYEVPGLRRAFEQAGVKFDDNDYDSTVGNFDDYFYVNGYDLDPWLENPLDFDYGYFGRDPYASSNLISFLDNEYDWVPSVDPGQAGAAYALLSLRNNPDLWGGLSDADINQILHEIGNVDWSLGKAREAKDGMPAYTDISGLDTEALTKLMGDEFWPQLVSGISDNYTKRRGSNLGYLSRGAAVEASKEKNNPGKKDRSNVITPVVNQDYDLFSYI